MQNNVQTHLYYLLVHSCNINIAILSAEKKTEVQTKKKFVSIQRDGKRNEPLSVEFRHKFENNRQMARGETKSSRGERWRDLNW